MRKFGVLNFLIFALALLNAFIFRHFQNQGIWIGGPISIPKSLWLSYTIHNWFFLTWAILFSSTFSKEWKTVVYFHCASWLGRAFIELWMIYYFLNWSPLYGMTHDLLHILIVFLLTLRAAFHQGPKQLRHHLLAVSWTSGVIFSTLAELVFAALFLTTRGKGESLIYFASDDPRYILINQITTVVCGIVFTHWFFQSFIAFYLTPYQQKNVQQV